jgi:hypothetical protein
MTAANSNARYILRACNFEIYGQLARRETPDELVTPAPTAGAPSVDLKANEVVLPEPAPLVPRTKIKNPQWFTDLHAMLKAMSFFSTKLEDKKIIIIPERYAETLGACRDLSREAWADAAAAMNQWSTKNNGAQPDPDQVPVTPEGIRGFLQLSEMKQDQLRRAFQALSMFNGQVNACLNFFDLQTPVGRSTLVDGLRDACDLVFSSMKMKRWKDALTATQKGESRPEIRVNPMKAAAFQESGQVDMQANQLFWGQAFQGLRTRPSTTFQIGFGGRAFSCKYEGMRSIDAGGPYRDVIERMSMDLMSEPCGLFLKSPNGIADMGENRNCWVPNPAATSRLQLEQFEFVGKMMGLALRTRNLFAMDLPSLVWKPLLGQRVNMKDIEAIDVLSTNAIKDLRLDDTMPVELYNTEMSEIKFTTRGVDSKVHELCTGGAKRSLSYANRHEYASLLKKFRVNEFSVQTSAIRRGLGKVVPLEALGLFSWRELETMVCGTRFSRDQVALLKAKTTFNAYSNNDQHIQWLWDILENDFNDEQRAMYLTFVWGRSRLPTTAAEFDTNHKISSRSGGDAAFPMAHTCFFTIDLPQYSSRAVMSQRIATAISMCGVIDGD